MFDRVVVAVGARHDKQTLFSAAERVTLIEQVTANLSGVEVEQFDGLIVKYAQSKGATVLVRGIRNSLDFAYEQQMAVTNRRLAPEIDTVLLAADPVQAMLSSSLIKEILKAGGNVDEFVPAAVSAALIARG